MEEPARSQWLRVWETIRFLNLLFLLQPQTTTRQLSEPSYFLDVEQPPLLSIDCYNGRFVQMSIGAISNILQEIIKDRRDSTKKPSALLYKTHLKALDSWHAELPQYLCLQTPSSEDTRMVHPEASYKQKTAILNVQSLFLGTVCELLQPALMVVLQDPASSVDNELQVYARRCVQSATVLIRLCDEIVTSNYPLSASWIAQQFLFNAALILIADLNRKESFEESVSREEHIECIQISENLLNLGTTSSSPYAIIIRMLCGAAGFQDVAQTC